MYMIYVYIYIFSKIPKILQSSIMFVKLRKNFCSLIPFSLFPFNNKYVHFYSHAIGILWLLLLLFIHFQDKYFNILTSADL